MINDIMDVLINDSIIHRRNFLDANLHLSPIHYAEEYKTVGIITPRRYGKSSYVKEFCKNSRDRIAIVVPNIPFKDIYKSELQDYKNVKIYTLNHLDNLNTQIEEDLVKPVWIFFDEINVDKKSKTKLIIYFNDSSNSLQTFIWLKT